ncbi:MAG TPA: hypothetical protein VHA56_07295 [Mucilaginibacter sp.]|nr:hypothetical protein [Mucilaginibacter sp.]
MKTRNNALHQYLLEADVLNGSKEAIAKAKRDYRKRYKRQWKQRARQQKEVRFGVTPLQLAAIKAKAQAEALPHTTYARNVVLASIDQPVAPNHALLAILQATSMAAIAIEQGKPTHLVYELVRKAELALLQYLNV